VRRRLPASRVDVLSRTCTCAYTKPFRHPLPNAAAACIATSR
jgi:hypothetical protein